MGSDRTVCELLNLKFEPSFFQGEVREGFFVSTMMKRYWAAQIEVLSEIARVCERHHIKWFADCGSLIGAIRHEGFIPWDDDLDICMLRDDWLLFFDVAQKELPQSYKLLTISQEEEYEQIIGRVVNSSVIDLNREFLEKFHGCPYTVGIDIFPLDGIYEDEIKEKERCQRGKRLIEKYENCSGSHKKRDLLLQIERNYSECVSSKAQEVALMPFWITKGSHKYPKALFEYAVRLPFENTYINVPARYEEVLAIEYRNYMQVVKDWKYHEYPAFGELEIILKENIGKNPYRYTLDLNALLLSIKRYTLKLIEPPKKRDKEIVVFLPCRAIWWKSMEGYYRACVSDENKEVHVLPIFYFDCDYNGQIGDNHDERAMFPEYVSVEDCEKFDFERIHPDKIVVQVPYDGFNTAMTVHEFFYSDNLLKYTDELIYIPCFDMEDPKELEDKAAASIKPLIEQPVVINADKVLLKSEMMKKLYVETLVELCGEETRNYWEAKILVWDFKAKVGRKLSSGGEGEEHKRNLSSENRKTVVYYVSISMLLRYREKAIDKIRRSLQIFEDSSAEIDVIYLQQEAIGSQLEKIDRGLHEKYVTAISDFEKRGKISFDKKGDALNNMDQWSSYYGEPGALAHRCIEMGIPVMIENVKV
ncbi:LicD family protein [Butyrivibrio sp.]|uniref:LicD family protein n=1 Tax=Butyrivibrio sp. TaxID=28121 RepID=UPI0025B83DDB|nr:LicD family protein [Butyrivibrio sp.]MBE5837086.1 LicD family protein [Butyrivibrio sp.]